MFIQNDAQLLKDRRYYSFCLVALLLAVLPRKRNPGRLIVVKVETGISGCQA